MKTLINLLILVLCVTSVFARTSSFYEFTDSEGECWRCYSDFPCERCIRSFRDFRSLWNANCPIPNCNDRNLRHVLFPSRESNHFFQCIYHDSYWMNERMECPCNTLFSFESQRCVSLSEWIPFCLHINLPIMYRECATSENVMIGTRRGDKTIEDIVIEGSKF